jgi:hypothetical protein
MNNTSRDPALRSFVDGLNESIRENPLAATLVGAGVFWMLFGPGRPLSLGVLSTLAAKNTILTKQNNESKPMSDYYPSDAGTFNSVRSQAADAMNAASTGASDAAKAVKDIASDVAGKASNTIDEVTDTFKDGARQAAEFNRRQGTSLRASLSKGLESQPLLLGALGLAIGAGIASAFPTTELEEDLVGSPASAAREMLGTVVENGIDSAISRGEQSSMT